MRPGPPQRRALLYGLAAVLLWSTVASAFKLTLQHLSPIQLLFWSSLASILALGLVLTRQGKWKELLWLPPATLGALTLPGLLVPWLYYLVLFEAYRLLPAQEAQPLNYSWAIVLTLLAVPIRGHRIKLHQIGAICLSYFGVLLIATQGHPFSFHFNNLNGVLLALGSTLIWSGYWLWQTRQQQDATISLFCNFSFALPFIALTLWLNDGFSIPDQQGLAGALYIGFFEMGLTYLLWSRALQLADNTAAIANLIYLSPFLSLVLIHLLVGEDILHSSYLGLLLIVAGILLQRVRHEEETP